MGSEEASQQKGVDRWIIPLALIVGAIFIFAYRTFLIAGAIHYGDVTPFPQSPQYLLDTFIYTWNPMAMGHQASADLPVILKAFYLRLTNNPVVAQQLFLFTPLPIGALFMYVLLSDFTSSRIARYIGSIIYAINPQVTYGGPPGPWVQAYSTFPIITFFFIRMLESESRRRSLLYSLLFAISFAYAFIYTFEVMFVFAFPFFIIILSSIILKRELKYAGKVILLGSGGITLTFTIVASYVLPFWIVSSQVLSSAGIEAYLGDLLATYHYANLKNLMCTSYLATNPFGYNQPGIVAASGLILPLLAFSSLFLIKDHKRKKYVAYFSTLAIVVIGFNWLLHLKPPPIIALIRRFPIMLVWRAPKATYLMPLAYCPLIALSLEEIVRRIPRMSFIRNSRRYSFALTSLFIFLVLSPISIYNWPIVTGDTGVSYFHYPSYSTHPSFYKIAKWVDQHRDSEGFFRTLWLPWSPDIRNIVSPLDPYHFGMPHGVDIAQSARFENSYLVAFTFEALCNRSTYRIGLLLALANVKYIIVLFKLKEYPRGTTADLQIGGDFWLGGDPDIMVDVLQKQRDLSLVEYNDEYAIFRNDDWYRYLHISSEPVLFIDTGTESFVKLSEDDGLKDNIVITNLKPSQRVELFDYKGMLRSSAIAETSNLTIDIGQNQMLGYIKILENEQIFCESPIFKICGGNTYGYTEVMQAKNTHFFDLLSSSVIPNFNLQSHILLFKSELSATHFKSILKETKIVICVGLEAVLENTELLNEIDKEQRLLIIYEDENDYQILRGQKEIVKNQLASQGFAIKIGESGQLSVPVHIFKDGQYRIMIRGSPNILYVLSCTINGNKTSLLPFPFSSLSWFQTPPLSLQKGKYNLNLTLLEGPSILLDQILVVNSFEQSQATMTTREQVMPISEPENLSDWSSDYAILSLSDDTPTGSQSLKMQTGLVTGDVASIYNPDGYWNWSNMDYLGLWLKFSKKGVARVMLSGEVNDTRTWQHWDFELEENHWTKVTLPLKVAFTAQSDPSLSLHSVDYIHIAAQNLINESITLQVSNIYVSKLIMNGTSTLYSIFSESNLDSTTVEYTKISPVELQATMSPNSTMFVIFGESFNKGWEGWQNVSKTPHFKVNAYGNGYYVNSKETNVLHITFAPQQSRNIFLIINALSLSLVIVLILSLAINKKKIRCIARILRISK